MPQLLRSDRDHAMSTNRGSSWLCLLLAGALVFSACTDSGDTLSAARDSAERGTVETGSPDEPGALSWARCTDQRIAMAQLECASLEVPRDPTDPDGPAISLALARTRATGSPDERIGSLVLNPGGPGGSGIEFLANASAAFPAELSTRFDLVSFDPRGVGASTPVRCLDDETKDEQLEGDLSPDDEEELRAALEDAQQFLEGCLDRSGEMIEHMSTADVAADLDRIREALGDDQLSYIGFSYGTSIGATYATLHPERVRALVLDGSVSPDVDLERRLLTQGQGFEATFENFVRSCDGDPACALAPDAATAVAAVRESLAEQPVEVSDPAGARTMGTDLFDLALATALYDTTLWGAAATAIATIRQGGAELLFTLVDRQTGRNPDGSFDNSSDAQAMVGCADEEERPELDDAVATAERVIDALPVFGEIIGWGALGCMDWPSPANPLPEITGAGADPVLVVGTLGDPATPYVWSEEMAETLESAVLLTYEGDGHTAFLRGGPCIDDAVVSYLVELQAPAEGTSCPAQTDDVSFGGLRDEVVSQFVDLGLPEQVATCVIDGIVDEIGSAEFDRLILSEDVDRLSGMVQEKSIACFAGDG